MFSQLSGYHMIQSGRHNINHRILQTLKYTNVSVQLPRHSHLIGVNYSLGIKIFKSTPGDFNVWPKLRTTNIIDHLSPDVKMLFNFSLFTSLSCLQNVSYFQTAHCKYVPLNLVKINPIIFLQHCSR